MPVGDDKIISSPFGVALIQIESHEKFTQHQ
jgi:hypothetical protein